jgi:ribonuclease HII
MDLYRHDQSFREQGYTIIAGIDEAGRGPVAGPVVAAAVVLPDECRIAGLRDSKKVPGKEMQQLFFEVLSRSSHVGVGIVGHEDIDRLNILRATRVSMQKAVKDLGILPDMLIIDAVSLPSVKIKQFSPFKAESKSASVAAASIIAKYTRDSIMLRYHEMYPEYNFKKHKGYCTQEHIELIGRYGPSPIHRKSFRKVMSLKLPF